MRAIGYFPGASATAQESLLEFCREHGHEAVALVTEPGEAGFRRLLAHLELMPALVVVPRASVLGRSAREAARRYFQMVALGADVLSLASRDDAGRELLQGRGADGMSERVRRAMARRAVKGEALGRPPFGYRVGEGRRLEVLPEEAEVVRLIFHLYGQGLGLRRLAQRLNELGLLTRAGRPWSVAAVRDILRNRVYVGTYRRFGVRVPSSHPALVSPREFERVQMRLSSQRQGGERLAGGQFPLSGLAVCGYCGGRMVGVTRRQRWQRRDGSEKSGEYRYYQYGSRVNRSLCDYHTWQAETLERRVIEAISGGQARRSVGPPPSARELEAGLRRLDERLARLLAEAGRGRLPEEEWRAQGVSLAFRRLALERARAGLPEGQAAAVARLERWHELGPEERREALLALVERVIVWDDHIEVLLRP